MQQPSPSPSWGGWTDEVRTGGGVRHYPDTYGTSSNFPTLAP